MEKPASRSRAGVAQAHVFVFFGKLQKAVAQLSDLALFEERCLSLLMGFTFSKSLV